MRDPELAARAQPAAKRQQARRGKLSCRTSAGKAAVNTRVRHFWARQYRSAAAAVTEQARDLASWTSGELPGQVTDQLASWPPGADQSAASA